jgi:hypothetical protein
MLTRQQIAKVRSMIQERLKETPFRLYIREEVSWEGRQRSGQALVHFTPDGAVSRASIWLKESAISPLATHIPYTRPKDGYWYACHVLTHEIGHVLQDTTHADLFAEHFAPHGIHEQEQFANAMSYCMMGVTLCGNYHPPTREQVRVVSEHTDKRGARLSIPRPMPHPWSEDMADEYPCGFCPDVAA